jgi:hypothetical protein
MTAVVPPKKPQTPGGTAAGSGPAKVRSEMR